MGINEFIDACWDLDGEGWTFDFSADQWWVLHARSETLGEFKTVTNGDCDVEKSLLVLYNKILKEKTNNKEKE